MKLCRVAMVFLLLLGYLQADIDSNEAKTELTGELYNSKDNVEVEVESMTSKHSTIGHSRVAADPHSKVPEVISLEEENKRLKAKIKELEEQIKALKEGDVIVEIKPESSAKAEVLPKVFKGTKLVIGAEVPQKLSTYYVAHLQNIQQLKQKLETNGFTVLAVTPILKGKTVLTITNDELLKTDTWLATLHLLVNKGNEIRVQNPSYFGAAYLQDKYKYGQFAETLKALQAVLGDMYEVDEKYALDDLKKYQFMFGMPYLSDTIKVGEGDDLLAKVTGENASKYVAYTLKLPNGNVLVGHKLRNIT